MEKPRLGSSLAAAVSLALMMVAPSVREAAAEDPPPDQKILQEIRAALSAREFDKAEQKLKEAGELDDQTRPAEELARLRTLLQFTTEFWKAVADSARTLQALDELVIGETRCAVVEFDGNVLVLHIEGKNVRYDRHNVPAKVAMMLAERVLKAEDANNKAIIGAFLLTDGKGSRKLAAKYLTEAQQGGADVAEILPELKLMPTIALDVPAMTPAMQRALAPASWLLHVAERKKIVRRPLGEVGRVDQDGRLAVALPEDAPGPVQVVFGRRQAGDFRCRILLKGISEGQRLGLFSPNDAGDGLTVSLPAGQVKAELVRQAGELQCRINGAEVKLDAAATSRPRMAGMLGLELSPGQSCVILWFELANR